MQTSPDASDAEQDQLFDAMVHEVYDRLVEAYRTGDIEQVDILRRVHPELKAKWQKQQFALQSLVIFFEDYKAGVYASADEVPEQVGRTVFDAIRAGNRYFAWLAETRAAFELPAPAAIQAKVTELFGATDDPGADDGSDEDGNSE